MILITLFTALGWFMFVIRPLFILGGAIGVVSHLRARRAVNRVDWNTEDHKKIWRCVSLMVLNLLFIGVVAFVMTMFINHQIVTFLIFNVYFGFLIYYIVAFFKKAIRLPLLKKPVNLIHGEGDVLLYAEMIHIEAGFLARWLTLKNTIRLTARLVWVEAKIRWGR